MCIDTCWSIISIADDCSINISVTASIKVVTTLLIVLVIAAVLL